MAPQRESCAGTPRLAGQCDPRRALEKIRGLARGVHDSLPIRRNRDLIRSLHLLRQGDLHQSIGRSAIADRKRAERAVFPGSAVKVTSSDGSIPAATAPPRESHARTRIVIERASRAEDSPGSAGEEQSNLFLSPPGQPVFPASPGSSRVGDDHSPCQRPSAGVADHDFLAPFFTHPGLSEIQGVNDGKGRRALRRWRCLQCLRPKRRCRRLAPHR